MAHASKAADVFISHAARDATLAVEVANACRAVGIEAVTNGELLTAADASDALWDALAESRALLTILSPSGLTPSMSIEIGAAQSWNKPIYAVVTDPASARLPEALTGTRLYTVGRLQDVIQEVRASLEQLTDEDRSILGGLYAEMRTPADQLALDPRRLETLAKGFERRSGKALPGERLLSELLRLRKRGELPRNRPEGRSRPKDEPT